MKKKHEYAHMAKVWMSGKFGGGGTTKLATCSTHAPMMAAQKISGNHALSSARLSTALDVFRVEGIDMDHAKMQNDAVRTAYGTPSPSRKRRGLMEKQPMNMKRATPFGSTTTSADAIVSGKRMFFS